MDFEVLASLSDFANLYKSALKSPSCLAPCFEEFCGGCKGHTGTADTLKQIVLKMTKNGRIPLPMVFFTPAELSGLSNKRTCAEEVFKLFDTRGLSRIDVMELFAAIAAITSGTLDLKVQNLVAIFGFRDQTTMSRDESHFMMDCLFRGIAKVTLRSSDTFYPRKPNYRLSASELSRLTESLFTGKQRFISCEELTDWLQRSQGDSKFIFDTLIHTLQTAMETMRDVMVARLRVMPMIKAILLNDVLARVGR